MKWLHVVPGLALVTLAGLAACERTESPEPFPQAAADGWLGSFNGGDVDGLMLIYSEDARVLPPEEPPISGHDAIQAFQKRYEPYAGAITGASGSPIAAAATAAR